MVRVIRFNSGFAASSDKFPDTLELSSESVVNAGKVVTTAISHVIHHSNDEKSINECKLFFQENAAILPYTGTSSSFTYCRFVLLANTAISHEID